MQRPTLLAVILALSLVMVACGGSSEEETDESPSEAPATTQVDAGANQKVPTTAEASAEEAASAQSDDSSDIAEHLRQRTMELWEVYNKHDIDGLKAFYEEDYWNEQEEEIRSSIQLFKLLGVQISVEETSPPTEMEPGKWETRHKGSFPLGSLNMVFIYEEFDGEWLLTYAESQWANTIRAKRTVFMAPEPLLTLFLVDGVLRSKVRHPKASLGGPRARDNACPAWLPLILLGRSTAIGHETLRPPEVRG